METTSKIAMAKEATQPTITDFEGEGHVKHRLFLHVAISSRSPSFGRLKVLFSPTFPRQGT
jgi:hypothetical protein